MGFHPGDLFDIQDDRQNGVARLALRGELDMATVPQLEEHLMLVEQDGVRAVLLDVRDLTFVDCMGLHTFEKAKSRAANNGHRFALVGANDQLRRMLHVTATQGILDEQEGLRLLDRFTQRSSDSALPHTAVDGDGNPDG
jgi:anti-sigma B factor antagonist